MQRSPAAARRSALADQDARLMRAVSDIGDSWTLLITWAISTGVTRFDALQRELGVARNILSERLRRQMRYGLVEKRPIAEGARRMEYRLTEKGVALAQALGALRDWAENWTEEVKLDEAQGDPARASEQVLSPTVEAACADKTSPATRRLDEREAMSGRANGVARMTRSEPARGGGHGAGGSRAASPE